MTDISITPASVLPSTDATIERGTAGATITAGQVVYLESSSGQFKLADCDHATAAIRSPRGIALHGASSGQPLKVLRSGSVTIGATLTPGTTYYLSPVAGGICPLADVASGDYATIVGIAASASVLKVQFLESGVAL